MQDEESFAIADSPDVNLVAEDRVPPIPLAPSIRSDFPETWIWDIIDRLVNSTRITSIYMKKNVIPFGKLVFDFGAGTSLVLSLTF